MALNQPCAFLHILVPDLEIIKHDHCYSLDPSLFEEVEKPDTPLQRTSDNTEYTARILDDSTIAAFKERLQVSSGLRHKIEESTRQQSSSMEWFSARAHRITSSMAKSWYKRSDQSPSSHRLCIVSHSLIHFLLPSLGVGKMRPLHVGSTKSS